MLRTALFYLTSWRIWGGCLSLTFRRCLALRPRLCIFDSSRLNITGPNGIDLRFHKQESLRLTLQLSQMLLSTSLLMSSILAELPRGWSGLQRSIKKNYILELMNVDTVLRAGRFNAEFKFTETSPSLNHGESNGYVLIKQTAAKSSLACWRIL